MKSRRMNEPHWNVPLEELETDLKRMLNVQWRQLINHLDDHDPLCFGVPADAEREYLEACWEAA